jgi:hypothetical protein
MSLFRRRKPQLLGGRLTDGRLPSLLDGLALAEAFLVQVAQASVVLVPAVQALRQQLQAQPPNAPPRSAKQLFVVDSQFLGECLAYCCRQRRYGDEFKEEYVHVAGFALDPTTIVLSHRVPVLYAEQSAVKVRVDDRSNIEAMTRIDGAGLLFAAHLHSHPGYGPTVNHPSGIDRKYQQSLEKGKHVAIGGIFSADYAGGGWLRFFAGDPERFEVRVFGNHVSRQEGEPHVLRLHPELADGHLSLAAADTPQPR